MSNDVSVGTGLSTKMAATQGPLQRLTVNRRLLEISRWPLLQLGLIQ